jgi:hypothetical protein
MENLHSTCRKKGNKIEKSVEHGILTRDFQHSNYLEKPIHDYHYFPYLIVHSLVKKSLVATIKYQHQSS